MVNAYPSDVREVFENKCTFTLPKLMKTTLGLATIIFLFTNSITGFALMSAEVQCINDSFHNFTENINLYLSNHTSIKIVLLITSGLLQDALFIVFGVIWIKNSNNFRFIYCLSCLLIIKSIHYFIFKQDNPVNDINEFPGVPSIMNNYSQGSYYFSFDISLLALFVLEFRNMKRIGLSNLSILVILCSAFVRISIRMNYCIDIIFACLFSHYIYIQIEQYSETLDGYVLQKSLKEYSIELKSNSEEVIHSQI
jgi:hypothetical protein